MISFSILSAVSTCSNKLLPAFTASFPASRVADLFHPPKVFLQKDFVLSFVLAYILHPLTAKLEKWRIGQGVASLLVTFGFCLLVVMVFLIVVPILQAQVVDFMRRIPQFSSSVWDYLKGVISYTKEK